MTYAELDAFYRERYVHAAKFVGGRKVSGFRTKISGVEYYLDAALDAFGPLPLTSITYGHLDAYRTAILNRPTYETCEHRTSGQRSISDTNHFLKRLRRVLNVAVEHGWLTVNPFKRGGPLVVTSHETERTRTLSAAEESRLLAVCTGRRAHLAPLIIFAIETGMRRGEIMALKWNAVDLTARVITVEGTTTKTLRTRMVPITSRLRAVLVALRRNQLRPASPVFTCGDVKRSFVTACRDAKLPDVHFHDLRHTAITRMLAAAIPPPIVMKISGHSQMKTFLRYVNTSETSIADIAEKLDRAAA